MLKESAACHKVGAVDIDALLGEKLCPACGKVHTCNMQRVVIKRGALLELTSLCEGYQHVTLVCDENTYRVCGQQVERLLSDKIDRKLVFAGDRLVVPNEDAISALEAHLHSETDLIIGVGSGVINDLAKHVSFSRGLPYYIVATAPSMDGYASKGAAMILGGMKVTTNCAVPRAIIADTAVLKDAPLEMLKAGYGDIIGKYSCLNDWRLSALVNGESLCQYIYDLTFDTVERIAKLGKEIVARDEEAISALMQGLVIVGIAMAYMGNSRPASGSEHHLSHYFEIVGLLRDEPYFCHGTDVAFSTYETAKLRKALIEKAKPARRAFSEADWEANLRRVYAGKSDLKTAEGIIAMQKKLGWIYEDKFDVYFSRWQEITEILASSPSPDKVKEMLDGVGLSLDEFYALYSAEKIEDALHYAKDLKDRYSVLWLYEQVM